MAIRVKPPATGTEGTAFGCAGIAVSVVLSMSCPRARNGCIRLKSCQMLPGPWQCSSHTHEGAPHVGVKNHHAWWRAYRFSSPQAEQPIPCLKAHSPSSAQRLDARSDTRQSYPNLSREQDFHPPGNVKPVKNTGCKEDPAPHLACILLPVVAGEGKVMGQEERAGIHHLRQPAWHFQSQVRCGFGRGL